MRDSGVVFVQRNVAHRRVSLCGSSTPDLREVPRTESTRSTPGASTYPPQVWGRKQLVLKILYPPYTGHRSENKLTGD